MSKIKNGNLEFENNSAEVDTLKINSVGNTTPIDNLGVDAFGNVVVGNTTIPIPVLVFFKDINIGPWDMTATSTIVLAHGLSATEWKTICNLSMTLRDDPYNNLYNINDFKSNMATQDVFIDFINSTIINIGTLLGVGGWFDNATYNSTAFSRGFIRFSYIPD